jgi:anti-sigma B factor antagonist
MVRDGAAGQEFPISSLDGLPVVTVPEELDLGNAHWFGEALQAAGASHPTMIVDMTRNEFCDSTGLAALITAVKRARAAGGEVRVVLAPPHARRVFKATGVDRFTKLFGILAEAAAVSLPATRPSPNPG